MAALSAIIGQLDRMAKGRQSAMANYASGTDFWDRVDAAADETYENAVKGTDMTALDTALAAGAVTCTGYARWWTLHNVYAKALGYADFGAYLTAMGIRIPYEANELAFESGYGRLTPASVFPKGTMVASEASPTSAGLHLLGVYAGAALTSVTALPTTVGPAAVMAVNMGSSATVGGTFTLTNWVASTTKDIALSLSSAAQYTQTVLGEAALAAGVSAGDLGLPVASTAAFTAGEWVLVVEGSTQEVCLVTSLGTGPTRLVVPALKNAYTTSAKVRPLFRSVAYKNGASGSGTVNFYAMPDRTIAL
jgi:hypothetical protein